MWVLKIMLLFTLLSLEHGFDQVKLSDREQTMKLVDEKYAKNGESLLPDIKLFTAENLNEDIARPRACNNTSKIFGGIFTIFATYQEKFQTIISIRFCWSSCFIKLFLTLGWDFSFYCESFLHAVVRWNRLVATETRCFEWCTHFLQKLITEQN